MIRMVAVPRMSYRSIRPVSSRNEFLLRSELNKPGGTHLDDVDVGDLYPQGSQGNATLGVEPLGLFAPKGSQMLNSGLLVVGHFGNERPNKWLESFRLFGLLLLRLRLVSGSGVSGLVFWNANPPWQSN